MSKKGRTFAVTMAVVILAGAFAVSREASGRQAADAQSPVETRLAAMEKKIAELEKQNAQLRSFITINGNSLTIKSAQAITIQAGADLLLKSSMMATLQAGSMAQVKGPTVRLNGGGKPVARVGDAVNVAHPSPAGKVIQGSPTVFVD